MATITKQKLAVALLVEDTNLYPRESIDDVHVTDLAHALRSGATLPPIIINDKDLRIADGVHRARAHRRVYGDDSEIEVERRKYSNDAEMFEDAIRLNASHGRKLQRIDQIRIIIKAREFGFTDVQTAAVLNLSEERVQELAVRVATSDGHSIPLKDGFGHFSGRTMTPEQAAEHKKQRSGQVLRLVNELIGRIEQNLSDLTALPEEVKAKLIRVSKLILEKLDTE